jgi:hypothetical protein
MVQARTRIMNQLRAMALNEGLRCKKKLWRATGVVLVSSWGESAPGALSQYFDSQHPSHPSCRTRRSRTVW